MTNTTDTLKHTASPGRLLALFAIPTMVLLTIIISSFEYRYNQQFTELAKAFAHGQLNFLTSIGGAGQDPVLYHGKIYWSEGPFPSVLLLPFVALFAALHLFFYQGYLQCLLVLGVFGLVYGLARRLAYSSIDSLVLAFGFTLGSVFIGVASLSASWFFAQVLTTLLLFWALYEYSNPRRRRWWLIGIICGLVVLTRATAAPIAAFFVLELWRESRSIKGGKGRLSSCIRPLLQLCLPIAVALAVIGLYNFARFHSVFKGGYADQLLFPISSEAQAYGVFSFIHIPTNLYSAFLRAPMPIPYTTTSWTLKFPFIENNTYGMSMFVTSPYLLYLFTQKWSAFDAKARNLLIGVALSALLVFSYFGVGLEQFGYRYSLDFLPGLFLLFMLLYKQQHKALSRGMKFLLLGAGLTNFYLLIPFVLTHS